AHPGPGDREHQERDAYREEGDPGGAQRRGGALDERLHEPRLAHREGRALAPPRDEEREREQRRDQGEEHERLRSAEGHGHLRKTSPSPSAPSKRSIRAG